MYCLCRQKGCGQEAMMMGLITNTVMVHKDAQGCTTYIITKFYTHKLICSVKQHKSAHIQ